MATIALYAGKLSQMSGLIQEAKQAVIDYNSELTSIRARALTINRSIVNLDDVISSIQASSQTQEEKIASLDTIDEKIKDFETYAYRTDSNVADLVNQRKDEFYKDYSWLKPGSEKNGWEKFWDGCKRVGRWCKDNWKLIATVVIVALAIVVIVFFPFAAPLLLLMAKGALLGALIGGVAGGAMSALTGGSFIEGFIGGAFAGAIAGIIGGGMGFALSAGGTVALSLGQTMLVGALAGAGSSLISDMGDKFIKGTDISWGQMFTNMAISGALGAAFAGVGYGIARGFSALRVRFSGRVTPLENGPYIRNGKPYGRPGPTGRARLEFERITYRNQVSRNGILRDLNTGEVLHWKPGQPRGGVVDFGHKAGRNYSRIFEGYRNGNVSLGQLKAFQSNPNNFRIESFSANRSHLFEQSFLESIRGYPWSSVASSSWKEAINAN